MGLRDSFFFAYLWFLEMTAIATPESEQLLWYSLVLAVSHTYNKEQFGFMQLNIPQATENFLAAL